ncbi:hypothetical protein ACOTVO_04970 [Aliarcobacter butzleri]
MSIDIEPHEEESNKTLHLTVNVASNNSNNSDDINEVEDIDEEEYEIPDIVKITNNFRDNIRSIQVFVEVIGKLADEHDTKTIKTCLDPLEEMFKKLKKEFFERIEKEENDEDKLTVKEKDELEKYLQENINGKEILNTFKKMNNSAPRQGELLRKNSLITLLSTFETLISNLIQEYYTRFPQALPNDTKKLTLAEIKELGSVEEAERFIIDSEIDSILRGDILSQLDYFEKKLKFNSNYISEYKDYLVETSQRRNILVHNDGVINKHYLKKTPNKFLTEEFNEGKRIKVNSKYLLERIELIHIIGIILIQECFRRWTKKFDECNELLIEIIFESLQESKYSFIEKLSKYINSIELYNEKDRKVLVINYCLTLKKQNKINEMKKELEKHDWSAVSDDFNLALAILNNEDEIFYKELNNLIITNKMNSEMMGSWPLFDEYREKEQFKQILVSLKNK